MLEAKLGNDVDYRNLTDAEKGDLNQAILKLIALRTINSRAGSQIVERNQTAQGLGAAIAGGFKGISKGGKTITDGNGAIPTRTLLDFVTDEIVNNSGTYGAVNVTLNAGVANQDEAVDFSFGKLAALEINKINA